MKKLAEAVFAIFIYYNVIVNYQYFVEKLCKFEFDCI